MSMTERNERISQMKKNMNALFLQSSLQDCEKDFTFSVKSPTFSHWDAVIITASNEKQAEGYRKQIEARKSGLPRATDFLVVPDEGDQRIGSAGSTLSVLKLLREKYGAFQGKKYLVIHAGGNSSRCPQYSALGKLFAPLPTTIGGYSATLFDMFLLTMASLPGRMQEGMLLLSGDVTLLFNPLMCDFNHAEAAAISFMEDVEIGKNHGVFVKNEATGCVKKFCHKLSVEKLKELGAVNEQNMCAIDTGALWLSPVILQRLHSMVDTEEKYKSLVNERVRLSLYSDIAYCLAEDSTPELFQLETPEGSFCPELSKARDDLFRAIGGYNMKLLSLSPARFIHFGSVPEILNLMSGGVREYEALGWRSQINSSVQDPNVGAYHSVLRADSTVGTGTYLEASYVRGGATVGSHSYISFLDVAGKRKVPDHVLMHGLKQTDGKFVCRIMGTFDNPKKNLLFGIPLQEAEKKLGANLGDTLWNSPLYPACDTVAQAVDSALNLYGLLVSENGDLESWQKAEKKSLCSGFYEADPQAILDWNARMEELVRMDQLADEVRSRKPVREICFSGKELTKIQKEWLQKETDRLDLSALSDFSYAIRLYYTLGTALECECYKSYYFRLIADAVLQHSPGLLSYDEKRKIVQDITEVKLPLRVNFGGGWTDTCPYCLENGGVVLNGAITLDGQLPVQVKLVRIPEKKVIFDSRDMDAHGEFDTIELLQNTGDPSDAFALQKACLVCCGIIPREGGDLQEILTRLGGGFELHSEVVHVPKGSGLGTSSILAAATVKALLTFIGVHYTDQMLYSAVLAVEQIMSTGGGWQDQVGGLSPGIKFISSRSGFDQTLKVETVALSEETKSQLKQRFAVIYTGQRRLARNLLRDVVSRYVGGEPDSVYAHKEIQKLATLMRFALEQGNVDEFAQLLNQHWKLSQKIDADSSNTVIELIFHSIDDLIDGRMCCGAGGGGFLQVVLKKGVTCRQIHDRLKNVFYDFSVDIWPAELFFQE